MPVPSPVQTLPPPQREEAKRVAVILGPGGAKAYAHAGVLKAFQQQRIPVEKVVGLEWGALMGAFFANKGQAHDMEWKLYRMEQQNLPKPHGGFFSKSEDTVHVMDRFLNDIFGKDDVANSKIAFTCPSRSVWSGVISWQSRGPFKEAIKRCLAYPPVFKVKSSYMAGATQAVEAIEMLAREGFNVIIFVNVLGSAMPVAQEKLQDHMNQVILWQEVKRALNEASRLRVETVNVDTSAYPIVRFESRKDLMSLGERVGTQAAEQLISKYHF
jgi:predicted acylesterase/phospholipase RssA